MHVLRLIPCLKEMWEGNAPNFATDSIIRWRHFRKFPSSNLAPVEQPSWLRFSCSSSVPPWRLRDRAFNFYCVLFIDHPIIRRWKLTVVKQTTNKNYVNAQKSFLYLFITETNAPAFRIWKLYENCVLCYSQNKIIFANVGRRGGNDTVCVVSMAQPVNLWRRTGRITFRYLSCYTVLIIWGRIILTQADSVYLISKFLNFFGWV